MGASAEPWKILLTASSPVRRSRSRTRVLGACKPPLPARPAPIRLWTFSRAHIPLPSALPGSNRKRRTISKFRSIPVTRVDMQLQVGQVFEHIEVSADSSVLQTEKSDVHVELAA